MKPSVKKNIVDLVHAGLTGESKRVELAAISLARNLKKENPEISTDINKAISSFSLSGASAIRNAGRAPLPIDSDTQLHMANILEPNKSIYLAPVLDNSINKRISSFLEERNKIELLLEKNIRPSTSILLTGQPGTGKTMLAKYIASELDKNLIVLDLSASMSSLMGKTGANLKKVLQYAKQNASVLLFDEFDAIAKKRDDSTDLGEIKRVVNILLMELEEWPVSSVFIGTSNHPELLDKAVWRRFDHTISIPLPGLPERIRILQNELSNFLVESKIDDSIVQLIAEIFEGKSAADICKYANNVKRRNVLREEKPLNSMFEEMEGLIESKKAKAKFCSSAKKILGSNITVRDLAEITGLSPAGVQYHIQKA
ncbi:AAA family ATPase [Muricauda sp. JGD-17]|uniref:AAA family ATPase n=1 Tax=Flagellimonas ochracea TaxID=2696472 RepID=A0A964TAB1_9FLAO|nr:ATP-binding protein [Allomuricauda ochracea]NAY91157.1 AAA family ATPase [Allomuricauda ochracea]